MKKMFLLIYNEITLKTILNKSHIYTENQQPRIKLCSKIILRFWLR